MLNPLPHPLRRVPARFALLLAVLVLGGLQAARAQTTYSRIIVFGDSLSDTGNDADVSHDKYGVRVPGFYQDPISGATLINYTDGRFTSGDETDPSSTLHSGVWHEQLAKAFLGLSTSSASLDGGDDYAYGGATTEDGTKTLDFGKVAGVDFNITVNNMGQQITDFLAKHGTVDPAALVVVWGGANDIFDSDSDPSALILTGKQAAKREAALITRLAQAGAVNFLVPNLPPIGSTPRYNSDADKTAAYDAASEAFNTRIAKQITKVTAALAAQGIKVNIKLLDVYGLFTRLEGNQESYNLYNFTKSSQGESVKPDHYLFWDDVHPTTSGHYQLAVEAFTVLTGTPVVQVTPDFTADGFWFTRSGTDDTNKLVVPYSANGTAVEGTDYATLKGHKNIKPDNYTVKLNVPALDGKAANDKTVSINIADGDDFTVGTVTEAHIQYGSPITNAVDPGVRTEFARTHSLLTPAGEK